MGPPIPSESIVIKMSSKIFALALLVASTQALSLKAIIRNTPEVTECLAGTGDWFSDISLNVSPYPVKVAEGESITIDGQFTLKQTVVTGSKLKLKLKGKTTFGLLPIPCLPINENLELGSCEYDLDKIVADLAASGACEQFLPEGQECSLPLNPGVYAGGDEPLVLTLPAIPDILIPILQPLKALVGEVYGVLPDGTEIACLGATVDMTFG